MVKSDHASLFLWKLDPVIGTWKMQREVTQETRDRWLAVFQKDEPKADFLISAKRPVTDAEKMLKRQNKRAIRGIK